MNASIRAKAGESLPLREARVAIGTRTGALSLKNDGERCARTQCHLSSRAAHVLVYKPGIQPELQLALLPGLGKEWIEGTTADIPNLFE